MTGLDQPLFREDGTSVNPNAEIQKLYQYAGWNPDTKTYDKPGKPIEWVRIHNLPDLVYFNHSQHVKVGQVSMPDLSWGNSENGRSETICRLKHGMVCQLPPYNKRSV